MKSNRSYAIAIVLSLLLITTVFFFTTRQIFRFGDTGNVINDQFNRYSSIEILFKNYTQLKDDYLTNSLLNGELHDDYWNNFETENKKIFDALKLEMDGIEPQMTRLSKVEKLQMKLSEDIRSLSREIDIADKPALTGKFESVLNTLHELSKIEIEMLDYDKEVVQTQLSELKAQSRFTTLIYIFGTIVAYILILLAFYKIFQDKNVIDNNTNFLVNLLSETQNIVNLYYPYYDKDNELVDFIIEYASKSNETMSEYYMDEMRGMRVSEAFPFLRTSGQLDHLIKSFRSKEEYNEVVEFQIDGIDRNFWVRYFPAKSSVSVMVSELTEMFEKTREVEQLNKELTISNKKLSEAEKIANLGSFAWDFEEKLITVSENMLRILELESDNTIFNYDQLKYLVHKEDRKRFNNEIEKARKSKSPIDFEYRIVTRDGQVKYINIRGEFRSLNKQDILLGTLYNITSQHYYEQTLKAKNIELIKQNDELESFNRIASHDLQEPLRKVQMYISRIEENEIHELSDKGKFYFERIKDASSRMRVLIDNILSFSKIENNNTDTQEVNLNKVIEEVKEDIAISIEESNATIVYHKLPSIQGNRYSFLQLFTNLLVNSIKYAKEDVAPIIEISSKKLASKEIDGKFTKLFDEYYQIIVKDNGIGFDEKHSKQIFEMFQRLHNKDQYSGTGIGLAICKKIVGKMDGFIEARSNKGPGTSIIIYLPVSK